MTREKVLGAITTVGNLGLDMNSPLARILRRAAVVGLITLIGELVVGYGEVINPVYLPILVAFGAAADKALREYLEAIKNPSVVK